MEAPDPTMSSLDRTTTLDGKTLELTLEEGFHVISVAGVPLMSDRVRGSEEAMASVARAELGERDRPRIRVGGLGMGFTLRAALDQFGQDADVVVAELLAPIVEYNRGPLADLAGRPLEDRRVRLYEGDVVACIERGGWDVILMDVDNGPSALTSKSNRRLYDQRGVDLMGGALRPGGVLVVWSAFPSAAFAERLRNTGLIAHTKTVQARWPLAQGPRHTLFVATS